MPKWWDDFNDVPGGNALRYYLGPAYEPVNALTQFGASMLPGADMVDMKRSGSDLMDYQGPMETLGDAGWLGLSTLGMALPGRPGALRGVADDLAGGAGGLRAAGSTGPLDTGGSLGTPTGDANALDSMPRVRPAMKIVGGPNDGKVISGRAGQIHADMLDDAYPLMGRNPDTGRFLGDVESGFVTEDGRYLTRMEAARYTSTEPVMMHSANLPPEPQGIRAYHGSPHDFDRNYVVFDDSLVSILRKYGMAGLPAGGGALGANALTGYEGEQY